MDYDDIVYDEGYSMTDIDDNWSNSDMDYETDSDSEMGNYNYNGKTNNWNTLTEDKINRQTNNHNNSFLDRINRKLESLENIDRSNIYIKVEKKNDSFLDLYERMKALNSHFEKDIEFEPHHRSSFTETVTDNWFINSNSKEVDKNLQMLKTTDRKVDPIKERVTRIKDTSTMESIRQTDSGKDSLIDNDNNTLTNSKVTDRAISITYKDKENDRLKEISSSVLDTDRQRSLIETDKKESLYEKLIDNKKEIIIKEIFERHKDEGVIDEGVIRRKLEKEIVKDDSFKSNDDSLKDKLHEKQDRKDVGIAKDMQKPKPNSSKESLRRKIEIEEKMKHERQKVNNGGKNNYGNSDSVGKVKMEDKDKKSNSFKEEINERLKIIDRTKNNSLIELAKKIEILSLPMETDRKRNITVLNTTELSDNEKTDRHVNSTICHKCKKYGHTKKQCDRHNRIVKQISKLEFEKDIIKELLEIFTVSQKEIDQVKKELKSTNPQKINKRKRKQKDIIIKLIENLPNQYKDKKEYLLKLKDTIEIPIACIRCRKYGHHITDCRKKEKDKKEKVKIKLKQDGVEIKPIALLTEEEMVKKEIKEIKEENLTDINKHDIVKEFSNSMIDPLLPPTDKEVTDINVSNNSNKFGKQNFLSLIDRVILQIRYTEITKQFSLTEIALTDSGVDINYIQERLIPLKYYDKSSERLIQANREKLITNYKIPIVDICHDRIYFETAFVLIKDFPSKIILGTPFMNLIYPFLMTDKGIKTNVLGTDIFFKFIVPPVLKEIRSSKKITILTDIKETGIYRTERSLSSLKTEMLLVNQLTENDKKIDRQDKGTEIRSYFPITHKVQSTEESIKDRDMNIVFCNQYAWNNSIWIDRWQFETIAPTQNINGTIITSFNNNDRHTDRLTEVLNYKYTLFIAFLNIHITDILKEFLTDSSLLNIKENINCGNLLNNDRFYLPIDRINPLIDCLINERLYEEIYSSTCMDRIIIDLRNILNFIYLDRSHHDYSNIIATQQEHKSVQRKVCFINVVCFVNAFITFLVKYFKRISQKDRDKRISKEVLTENICSKYNPFPKTQLQTTMSKRFSQKDKGKAPAVQPKGTRKPSVKISEMHEGVSIETISLQDTLLADAMYSCGDKSVILQKVLDSDLMFQDGEFTDLPFHIKLLLDNLQAAFTLRQKPLFQMTLQALELHLVSTGAFIEALDCQLPSKEDGDSSSTKTDLQSLKSYLMGTSFSKLHPRIQQKTRLAIRTLPPEIQQNILTHKAITSSYDRWMYLFKLLVSTAFIRTEDMTDHVWLSHKAKWYDSFGNSDRVYERTGDRFDPYPGLLINTETEDPVICDPLWLSEMLEAGFIRKLTITSANQISLFPRVIQEAAAQIGGLNYMKIEIWSTLPVWDTSYYMEAQPAHILVLIHDWCGILEYNWYTGDTYLPLDDPGALAQEWSNFMSNKIYEEQKELDRGFHLYGYTDRIAVYGPRPSAGRLIGKRRIVKDPRLMTAKDHVPVFVPILYCALCNDYGVLHEHEQYEDNSDPLDYDNYADTD